MLRFSVFGSDMLRLIDDEHARRRDDVSREREAHRTRPKRSWRRRRAVEARPPHHWVPAYLAAA